MDLEGVVFDVDGTLYDTRKVSIAAVLHAEEEMGQRHGIILPMPSEKRIVGMFGERPEDIFRALLPEEYWPFGNEFLELVGQEEIRRIRKDEGALFPGVLETLGELKKRGYVLGIYSNGHTDYFRTILEVHGLSSLAHFAACIGEHPYLQKPGLLALVKDRLGVRRIAVVGDRYHDVEAAHELGDVSIGARYGFGGNEMEKADRTISTIGELLTILPSRN
ncbi:MAG: HAD family hydrolase [Thermoplasmata archaeon]|nr:HAD family hydrolase [Thermoplasmata archaeon]